MRFRTYKNTDLTVSEVGFGLWTISTGWWGNFTEGEAIALMHKAFDLGITLFDAADTYGNGLSEELIAKAFPNQRDEIVIATKVGYDFVHSRRSARTRAARNSAGFFAGSHHPRDRRGAETIEDRPDRSAPTAQHSDGTDL